VMHRDGGIYPVRFPSIVTTLATISGSTTAQDHSRTDATDVASVAGAASR